MSCTKEEIVKSKYVPMTDIYTDYQLDMLNQLNAKRAEYGAGPVIPEITLTLLAKTHANYMDRIVDINHDYFWSRYIESQSTRFGEVCAYNYETIASEITAFENSEGHLNCMINPSYEYCGIYKQGDYLCIDFASYKPTSMNKTAKIANNKNKNITSIEIN
tara:strand:- start:169 stop:651 length:483 start_codon:yes stop_codon:yes gene_type:complete